MAKRLAGKAKKGAHFELAPQPTDIIWDNITMTDGSRTKNRFFGGILLVVFCFFYCIPLVVVSLLANLAALWVTSSFRRPRAFAKLFTLTVEPGSSSSRTGRTTTPSSSRPSSEWFLLSSRSSSSCSFPSSFGRSSSSLLAEQHAHRLVARRWIASLQGCATHSQADRIVTARYSAFLFITQFFIFSVLGVAVQIAMKLYVEIDGKADASEIWTYVKTIPDQL